MGYENSQKMITKVSSSPYPKSSGASNVYSHSSLSPSLAEDIPSPLLCPLYHSKYDFSPRGKFENLKKGLEKKSRNG